MSEKQRRLSELFLAWMYGNLNQERDDIESIPSMTDDEIHKAIATKGELIGWE